MHLDPGKLGCNWPRQPGRSNARDEGGNTCARPLRAEGIPPVGRSAPEDSATRAGHGASQACAGKYFGTHECIKEGGAEWP